MQRSPIHATNTRPARELLDGGGREGRGSRIHVGKVAPLNAGHVVKKKSPCCGPAECRACKEVPEQPEIEEEKTVAEGGIRRVAGRAGGGSHPVTRAAHERGLPMHMLDIPMDSAALWRPRTAQVRTALLPSASLVRPPFAPRHRLSFFLPLRISLSKHRQDSPPPFLPAARAHADHEHRHA